MWIVLLLILFGIDFFYHSKNYPKDTAKRTQALLVIGISSGVLLGLFMILGSSLGWIWMVFIYPPVLIIALILRQIWLKNL